MKNPKIYPLVILLLIGVTIFVAAGQDSKTSLVSGEHQIVATIHRQGEGFGENEVLSFQSPGGEELLTIKSSGFEKPVLFHYQGESFIHVSTIPAGSGAFVTDTIFWIAPDATMHEIDFESAAEAYEAKVDSDESVLTGGSSVICTGGELKFEFYIARNGDPHCCPTAGKVTGSYQIVGKSKFDPITKKYSSTFQMVAREYSRTPIVTGELYAKLRALSQKNHAGSL